MSLQHNVEGNIDNTQTNWLICITQVFKVNEGIGGKTTENAAKAIGLVYFFRQLYNCTTGLYNRIVKN